MGIRRLRREIVIAVLGYGAIAVAIYAPQVLRGGWYYDDWDFIEAIGYDGPLAGGSSAEDDFADFVDES